MKIKIIKKPFYSSNKIWFTITLFQTEEDWIKGKGIRIAKAKSEGVASIIANSLQEYYNHYYCLYIS